MRYVWKPDQCGVKLNKQEALTGSNNTPSLLFLSLPPPPSSCWQDLGYLIIYITGRSDVQKEYVLSFLGTHAFPLGLVSCADGLSIDSHNKTIYLARLIKEVRDWRGCSLSGGREGQRIAEGEGYRGRRGGGCKGKGAEGEEVRVQGEGSRGRRGEGCKGKGEREEQAKE